MKLSNKHFAVITAGLLFMLPLTAFTQNWLWAKAGSGTAEAEAVNTATDNSGNVYAVGFFWQGTLKFGSVTLTNTSSSYSECYLVKYNRTGGVVWAKQSKGGSNAQNENVAVDKSGNIYITGLYQHPIIFGTDTLPVSGFGSSFVVKYNTSGQVQWATKYGGPWLDGPYHYSGNSITTDPAGNIYLCGDFQSNSIQIGGITVYHSGGAGTYLAKYDSQGNGLWVISPQGGGVATCVTSDKTGNIYLSGFFIDTMKFDNINLVSSDTSNTDMFLVKYDSSGHVIWAQSAQTKLFSYSPEEDLINLSTAIDKQNNVYVSGTFQGSQVAFGNTTLTNIYAAQGGTNPFLAKYDSTGQVLWAKSGQAAKYNYGMGVALDTFGNAYCVGAFGSNNQGFPVDTGTITFGSNTIQAPLHSWDPAFIVSYDPNGNVLCAAAIESGGDDRIAVSANRFGEVFVFGDVAQDTLAFNDSLFVNPSSGETPFVAKFSCSAQVLSTNAVYMAPELKVYPNPTMGNCTLQYNGEQGPFTATLLDATGREVMQLFRNQYLSTYNFNTQMLLPGLYLIQLKDERGCCSLYKLVKN